MKKLVVLVSALLVPAGSVFAQIASDSKFASPVKPGTAVAETAVPAVLTLDSAALAAGVENKMPVGEATTFTEAEKVYCWTRFGSVSASASVRHVWYLGAEKMLEVELQVPSSGYRTYSYKTVVPGSWKVEVVDAAGTVLKTLEFTVAKTETPAEPPAPDPVSQAQPAVK
ncbi:MAG: DUF2914 domain-containing protein [Elusimicrobiaceae bacterium]|nr:DUF2914 domain-containing protein [Elusimicrobiaceae bacterium]